MPMVPMEGQWSTSHKLKHFVEFYQASLKEKRNMLRQIVFQMMISTMVLFI